MEKDIQGNKKCAWQRIVQNFNMSGIKIISRFRPQQITEKSFLVTDVL